MYFESRRQAGEKLAAELGSYRFENTAIIALSEGGVAVAQPIAESIHSTVSLLMSRPVNLPSAAQETIGSISQSGTFVFDDGLADAEAEELETEFHGFIEEEKIRQMHDMNQLLGEVGVVEPEYIRDHNIVVVADGLAGTGSLEALEMFLKPIRINRLIAAVPIVTVPVIDKIHIMFDEIHCLSVLDNFLDTDHYYNDEAAPDHDSAMAMIRQTIKNWA